MDENEKEENENEKEEHENDTDAKDGFDIRINVRPRIYCDFSIVVHSVAKVKKDNVLSIWPAALR